MLSLNELEEILLDVEQCSNKNRPMYSEEDPDYPVLTLNALVFGQVNTFPTEYDSANIGEKIILKRTKINNVL